MLTPTWDIPLLLAQGGTGSPPAGGGAIDQVAIATVVCGALTAGMFGLVLAHRGGRTRLLARLADAAADARWFVSTAWQGAEGRSVVSDLEEVSPGVWRTTEPIPVYGNWKSTVRLHEGTAVLGVPVYMPADEAISVEGIPARAEATRTS
jgi:hypothetical protein